MRRAIFRAIARRCGKWPRDWRPGRGQTSRDFCIWQWGLHRPATYLPGRFDGKCRTGDHIWIGPQSYFEARDLVSENFVGRTQAQRCSDRNIRQLRSASRIVQTDLEIKLVRIGAGSRSAPME
jgi:hypothetical protein